MSSVDRLSVVFLKIYLVRIQAIAAKTANLSNPYFDREAIFVVLSSQTIRNNKILKNYFLNKVIQKSPNLLTWYDTQLKASVYLLSFVSIIKNIIIVL